MFFFFFEKELGEKLQKGHKKNALELKKNNLILVFRPIFYFDDVHLLISLSKLFFCMVLDISPIAIK